jgi:hypothetical protein
MESSYPKSSECVISRQTKRKDMTQTLLGIERLREELYMRLEEMKDIRRGVISVKRKGELCLCAAMAPWTRATAFMECYV